MFVAASKTILGLALVVSLGFAASSAQAAPSGGCVVAATTTCTFSYTGAPEAWVVPAGVTSAVFDGWAAAGGTFPSVAVFPAGAGGQGAHVQATEVLTPGSTLDMRVGGAGQNGGQFNLSGAGSVTVAGGFNGGGTNTLTCSSACGFFMGAGGGGSSDVRTGADGLANRILVAGGGGGAAPGGANTTDAGDGGNSATAAKSVTGGLSPNTATCSGGGPGTIAAPGAPGTGSGCVSGQGGDPGGLSGGGADVDFVGAGGGGYFGGGAGAHSSSFLAGSGGGGGSDYVDPSATNVAVTDGVRGGNGLITVTYTTPTAVTFASASANRASKGVLVRWRTGTEADLLGFHVYRSHGGAWQRLTRSLIAARGSVSGHSYRFLDRTARRGVGYRYRVRAVNRDGTAAWFGPVRVT